MSNKCRNRDIRNRVLLFAAHERLDLHILVSKNITEFDFNIVPNQIIVVCFVWNLNTQYHRLHKSANSYRIPLSFS